MSRAFEDAVQNLQAGLRALELLFRGAAPEDEQLAIVHGRIAAAVYECRTKIETLLFETDDLEETARLARFDRFISEMGRERRLAIVARLERILGES